MIRRSAKEKMHPRNRFRDGYDFAHLVLKHPPLRQFVAPNAYGDDSIDYANPDAVKALNQALLAHAYGVVHWDLPRGYLCPPIPGRSDYIHYLADLLSGGPEGSIPRGRHVAVLDIGTGANCIYPLIGASEYGWRFVATEVDSSAHHSARKIAAANNAIAGLIENRFQSSATECFKNVVAPGEFFDASICNPPFHASAAEAEAGNFRKRRNLGGAKPVSRVLNFGGTSGELWCPGGELAFVRRMITQSADVATQVRWFTTLVSKGEHLPRLYDALRVVQPARVHTIDMSQGQKQSRILAWTFAPVGLGLQRHQSDDKVEEATKDNR